MPRSWNPFQRTDPTFAILFERAGQLTVDAAEALEVLFGADLIDAGAFARLDDLEHRADVVTHDILSRLERGFRSPLPAVETRRLIGEIDSIIDAAESAGELAVLCNVGQATPTARGMTAVLVKSAREIASLVGFIGGGSGYRPYVARLHEYEHEGDDLWTEGFASLFTGDLAPLDVIRWQAIYEQLEAAIDGSETAGRVIELALDRSRT